MEIYNGSELKDVLLKGQKAQCVSGMYIGFTVSKWQYGDVLVWESGEVFTTEAEENPYFKNSRWKIVVDDKK